MLFTLLPDLNLAPLKYAHIHKDHQGPIASISFRERSAFFEAFAFLDSQRTGYRPLRQLLYGEAHGMGSAATKAEAIYCAISEALERWAWQSAGSNPRNREALRFDLDPSTSGFAAFPGLGLQGARKRAYFEAAERWSLCTWWEGRLEHQFMTMDDTKGVQIQSPIPGVSVVVVWSENDSLRSYGFAASHTALSATEKAKVELRRNQDVLSFYRDEKNRIAKQDLSLNERRLAFFAEPAGVRLFSERLARPGTSSPPPALTVDQAVLGPWSQYAHVWRCLFDSPPFRENDRDDYFLF
jgi:hypothetical protein